MQARNARDPGSTSGRGNIFRNKFITIFKIWENLGGLSEWLCESDNLSALNLFLKKINLI